MSAFSKFFCQRESFGCWATKFLVTDSYRDGGAARMPVSEALRLLLQRGKHSFETLG